MTSMLTRKDTRSQEGRPGRFEVKHVVFTFFGKLEIFMRGILPHYVLGGSVSKEEVHAYIMHDEDLLFHRDILSGQLSHETARALKDFFLCSSFVVCKQL